MPKAAFTAIHKLLVLCLARQAQAFEKLPRLGRESTSSQDEQEDGERHQCVTEPLTVGGTDEFGEDGNESQ